MRIYSSKKFLLQKANNGSSISFFLLCIFTSLSIAQNLNSQSADSLELIKSTNLGNILTTNFLKQLSTYNLNTQFDVSKSLGEFDFLVNEKFNSTFVRSSEKSIRDEQLLMMRVKYKLFSNTAIGIGANSSIFSDNRKIEINQASTNQAYFFSQIEPYENIFIAPFFGYLTNRQVLNDDRGFLYGTEAKLNNYRVTDLIISSDFRFRNEDISPRKNTNRFYSILLNSRFNENVSNFLNGGFTQNRKDFYFEADSITSKEFNVANNIQSRIETNYSLQDRLLYNNLFDLFSLDIAGVVNWRKVERDTRYKSIQNSTSSIFDTEINELKLDFESLLSYNSKTFNGLFRVLYSERDEKNLAKRIPNAAENLYQNRVEQEGRKNNNSVRASLSFLGNLRVSNSDHFSFSFLHNKLRYDTPSKLNYDDRDELLSIIRLRYTKQLTPFFEAFVNSEGTYNQTVYIFSQKSSNNNINRILKLAAGGAYKGAAFSSLNSFEVSANYTVYDFQDLNPNIKSYSFRQFTALDSTNYRISKKAKVSLYGYVKLSEQGDLKWNEFASRPTRFLQEIYCEPRITIMYNIFQYSVGLRFFSLSTFNFKQNDKILDSKFESAGPIAEIMILRRASIYVRIYGWYEFITLNSSVKKEQTNLNVEMSWSF